MTACPTLGADPELFVCDGDGQPVSAHKFFPYKDKKKEAGGKPFRDGYVVELNPPAGSCRDGLIALWIQQAAAAEAMLPPGYSLKPKSAFPVELAFLKDKDTPDDLRQFGCDPSFDAYSNGKAKHPTVDAISHPWRYAGGHMHFGVSTMPRAYGVDNQGRDLYECVSNPEMHPMAIKLLDRFVGLPLTYVTGRRSTFTRRKVYGGAGEYRPQKYSDRYVGLEYRTPGPEMWADPVYISLAYGAGRYVLANFHHFVKEWDPKQELALAAAINTGDNIEKLLPTLPGYYTPELLTNLKSDKRLGRAHWVRMNAVCGFDWWATYTRQNDKRGVVPRDMLWPSR